MTLDPKDILNLPLQTFVIWENTQTKTCAIVYTSNLVDHYTKALQNIQKGSFKYRGAEQALRIVPSEGLSFMPLIMDMHQKMHDDLVAEGWDVISFRPTQRLKLTMIPSTSKGWVLFLESGTSRYRYERYDSIGEMKEAQAKLTVQKVLQELNERDFNG